MSVTREVIKTAVSLSKKLKAKALIILTETGESYEILKKLKPNIKVIVATPNMEIYESISKIKDKNTHLIKLFNRSFSIQKELKEIISIALDHEILNENDIVVAVGSTLSKEANSLFVFKVKREDTDFSFYRIIKSSNIKSGVLEKVLEIALEIGMEGREGKHIGTAFIVGDSENVLKRTKQLILNPFAGHEKEKRLITNPDIKETVKSLAQLDGVFIISEEGEILTAGAYLNVDTSRVDIPHGLGARHAAVAAITKETNAIGVCVSQSGGIVRVFKDGKIVLAIEPQKRYRLLG